MIQNKTKKAIIRALQENRRLRWGELKDIVVNEFDAGSERIFRQTLKRLPNNIQNITLVQIL
jgi:hypothetical protein